MQYIVLFFQQKISFTNNFTSINIKKAPEVNRTLYNPQIQMFDGF